MNEYHLRLKRDIASSLEAALRMIEQPQTITELAATLCNVRTQSLQAAMWSAELFGAISEKSRNKKS